MPNIALGNPHNALCNGIIVALTNVCVNARWGATQEIGAGSDTTDTDMIQRIIQICTICDIGSIIIILYFQISK